MGVGATQAERLGARFRQWLMVVREVTVRVRTPQFVVPLFAVRDSDRGVGINTIQTSNFSLFMSLRSSLCKYIHINLHICTFFNIVLLIIKTEQMVFNVERVVYSEEPTENYHLKCLYQP